MKHKNKDGIQLNIGSMTEVGRVGSAMDLVQEVVGEAVKLCSEYNRWDKDSMGVALSRTRNFLIENFDLEDENG